MKLKLFDQILDYVNDVSAIEEMFAKINEAITSSSLYFSHLIVDGTEVYENHDAYIAAHIDTIKEIEVIALTKKDYINELLHTTETYLTGSLPEIKLLTEAFYQGPTEQTWNNFAKLIEALQWIDQLLDTLQQADVALANLPAYKAAQDAISQELGNLEAAVEAADTILIADIILYEIYPALEELKSEITTTIDQDGQRLDAN